MSNTPQQSQPTWRQLAEAASKEKDLQRLASLVAELNGALELGAKKPPQSEKKNPWSLET